MSKEIATIGEMLVGTDKRIETYEKIILKARKMISELRRMREMHAPDPKLEAERQQIMLDANQMIFNAESQIVVENDLRRRIIEFK